jgi:hypothetical protein
MTPEQKEPPVLRIVAGVVATAVGVVFVGGTIAYALIWIAHILPWPK